MKKIMLAVLAAASVAVAEETGEAVESNPEATEKVAAKPSFMTLPLCRVAEGEAFVRPNGAEGWEPAKEGKFYPLGTAFRTAGSGRIVVAFANDSAATITGDAEFLTVAQVLGIPSRTVRLVRGAIDLQLADNLPEGAFILAAPGFMVKNPAGESRCVREVLGDGDKVSVYCKTGSLAVEGRHFEIPAMRASCEVVIRTSHDLLNTFLFGVRGDYAVKIDQDVRIKDVMDDDGAMKQVQERGFSEFRLSPETRIVINRMMPAIGSRMSAFVMAFDASGKKVGEGISICEGRAEINSGDLVSKEKLDEAEIAKRASEATETTTADVEDAPAEDDADSGSEDSDEM